MTSQAEATKLEIAVLTHPGRVRPINEDSILSQRLNQGELVAVADGMGGHRTGEVASSLAVQSLLESLTELGSSTPPESLARAFQRANLAVFQQAQRRSESRGMGTTLTAILVDDQFAIVGHVGDSRAYLLRDGKLQQLTRDHSWVAERVRQGLISEQEAREHRWRNVITNALGSYPQVRLDLSGIEVRPDDVLLVCSDGLTTVLNEHDLTDLFEAHQNTPLEQLAEVLVNTVNEYGAPDNVSVALVRVQSVRNKLKTYLLPRLQEENLPSHDPEPDVKGTMILEPVITRPARQSTPIWQWVIAGVLYIVFFMLAFLLK
jgi:PPM family protein phosphatase